MCMKTSELESRLIDFAVECIEIAEDVKSCAETNCLSVSIIKNASLPVLYLYEAEDAVDIAGLIRISVMAIKELSKSRSVLRNISLKYKNEHLQNVLDENEKLITEFREYTLSKAKLYSKNIV
jgi:hypothetical protein